MLWELVRTSGSTAETKFKKSVFWDTLLRTVLAKKKKILNLETSEPMLPVAKGNYFGHSYLLPSCFSQTGSCLKIIDVMISGGSDDERIPTCYWEITNGQYP